MLSQDIKIQLWNNKLLLRSVVERSLSFEVYYSIEQRMIVCPFHYDSRPSAKFFEDDDDGVIRLHCFSENRQFTVYDYITDILGLDAIQELDKRTDALLVDTVLRDVLVHQKEFSQQRTDKIRQRIDLVCQQYKSLEDRLCVLYSGDSAYE